MTYAEKLRDPRWQKKRLEILARDGWTCRVCHDTESTLHVHHIQYLQNHDPWDYPNDLLLTLCNLCHELEQDRREMESFLLDTLREHRFMLRHIENLCGKIINGEISPL
jgi:5-methylcytosine-specific restriction endonuclease McrA